MGRIKAPAIYSGFVISMIGQMRGQRVPMDLKAAESCVVAGTARWEDDETPIDKSARQEIERAETERLEQIAADAPPSVEDVMTGQAKSIIIAEIDGKFYLSRPFPAVAVINAANIESLPFFGLIEGDDPEKQLQDGDIAIELENGLAVYRTVTTVNDGAEVIAERVTHAEPEVTIPDDWRSRHFLANISAAKLILGFGRTDKITKDEAEAVIEKWIAEDDSVQGEVEGGEGDGDPTNENGRILNGNHAEDEGGEGDDEGKTPEQIAQERARKFAEDDFND